jgi:DUF3060 family protein
MVKRLFLGIALVAAAVAPAGADPTWKLDANQSQYSYVCGGGEWISVTGNGNSLSLTGDCGQLDVTGSDNRVAIDGISTIRVSGNNNDIRYARVVNGKKKPAIKKKGAANTVRRSS